MSKAKLKPIEGCRGLYTVENMEELSIKESLQSLPKEKLIELILILLDNKHNQETL